MDLTMDAVEWWDNDTRFGRVMALWTLLVLGSISVAIWMVFIIPLMILTIPWWFILALTLH